MSIYVSIVKMGSAQDISEKTIVNQYKFFNCN